MSSLFSKTTKTIAATLAAITALLTPAAFLGSNQVFAAAEQTKYIKEIRVYSGTHKDKDDAEDWCRKQPENKDNNPDNDWAVFSDNLDKGADGAMKKWVGVYLCYQTTTDPKEAVRDLAVMNEQGNYSEGAYERILKEQRDMYADMVNDSKNMIEEYRVNYQNGLPTAVQAHDFMNTYKEDDSGMLFGDFMLTVSDDDLTEVLLQANGQAVLMMQEQLAYACDTGKSTWLDRLSQLGSYETLRKQAYKACNNDARKAEKVLAQKYGETAKIIAENWNDIYQHVENIKAFSEQNGLNDMTADELAAFYMAQEAAAKDGTLDEKTYVFLQEKNTLSALAAYPYGEGTLYDYFNRDRAQFEGDQIRELYPLAASLSKGQTSALNETVSLYTLLMDAQAATASNPYTKGMAAELKTVDDATKKESEEIQNEQQKIIDEWKDEEPVSIYAGIDRGVYGGGVAVTSNTHEFGKSKGASWTDSFVENGGLLKTSVGLGVGSLLCVGGAVVFSKLMTKYQDAIIYIMMSEYGNKGAAHLFRDMPGAVANTVNEYGSQIVRFSVSDYKAAAHQAGIVNSKQISENIQNIQKARDYFLKKGMDFDEVPQKYLTRYKVYQGLEIGMAVTAIIIAVLDITMTTIELYKYYNRDHLPIPHYMVDVSYNENKETSFIAYRGVLDQDGDQGDLNGGSGKQWLALYASYDEDAGDPILAPDGDLHKGITQRGKSTTPDGYSPLHFFGKPNAPQNLTFADGDNGWSYNDDEGGTYFFFERGTVSE